MLELSRDMTEGSLPYCVTPEHTAMAKEIMGPDKWLCVEQKIVFTEDESVARGVAAKNMARYLAMPNYVCLLYTSPSPRDGLLARMPSSA